MAILKRTITSALCILVSLSAWPSYAEDQMYGETLCQQVDYHCIKVKRGQTWASLFPHPVDRDLLKRINRMNIPLTAGMTLAVPDHYIQLDKMDIAPFNYNVAPQKQKLIVVSLEKLAWGAYDTSGQLVNWGPIAAGKSWCEDVDEDCETVTGEFYITRAEGESCVSTKFPVETATREAGGASMPYCMYFHGGYALHGAFNLPGYNASHGCVRLFPEDARWLYYEFIEVPGLAGGKERTQVIVE